MIQFTSTEWSEFVRCYGASQQQVSELEQALREQRRIADRMGRRMAKQRRHIADLLAMIIAKNGGTRRERAVRDLTNR